MATYMRREYLEPPIAEALCEVYFAGSKWDSTVPGTFYARVQHRFPEKGELAQSTLQVAIGARQSLAMRADEPRMRFSSSDGSQLLQLQRDLLVVNQLRPYAGFEAWRALVLEMVPLYRELACPRGIDRIGVRYLNQVIVPETDVRLNKYFALYPQIPSELGHADEFLLRIRIPAQYKDHELLLTFGTVNPAMTDVTALVLDIFDNVPLGDADDFDSLPKWLDEAHENIDTVFEQAITQATRTLFKEKNDAAH
jgi:uncharacterized protein (TIGR04255 family)